jgi:hypothetical protein
MDFFKKRFYPIAIFVLLGTMFLLMFFSAKGDSVIVDEIAHIPSGYSYITTGDYRLNPEHPPLIKDLAALPLTLLNLNFPQNLWESNNPVINNQWEMGWSFLFKMGNNPDMIKLAAEIPIMLLSLLFGFFVYLWAKELFGKKAGLFALILFVFNVNIIAHSRFVTTDLGISFAFFLSTYTVYRYIKKPNWKNLIIAGLVFGVVLITKFSAAVLAPTYLLVWALLMLKKGNESNKTILEQISDKKWTKRALSGFFAFAVIVLIGITTMWLYYIPHTINMPAQVQKDLITESQIGPFTEPLQSLSDNALTKPLAQWFLGFTMVTAHVEGGHDAFLLGMTSNQGWWYYYPVVIFLKTQIPIFIFLILAIFLWKKLDRKDWFTETYLWVLPLVLLAMGMQGKLCLGIRYMLPIYAFIFVFISPLANLVTFENLKKTKNNLKQFGIAWLIVIMMAWYILSGLLTYPHYLSYFNEFVGGYKNGYKYLTDSNIDWGQDIKRLNQWTIDNNIDKIYVDVFPGSFDPEMKYYLGDKAIEWHVQNGKPTGYLAVSATFYQNSKLKKAVNGVDYSWLDNIEPVDNVGGSILIYKL